MHPYVHTFNAAINPPWDARTDFELFQDLSAYVSKMAEVHLPEPMQDVIASPLTHDSPDELLTPHGRVAPREEIGWVPGVNMPKLIPVVRDYRTISDRYNTVGPLIEKAGMATKGLAFNAQKEIDEFIAMEGTLETFMARVRAWIPISEHASSSSVSRVRPMVPWQLAVSRLCRNAWAQETWPKWPKATKKST